MDRAPAFCQTFFACDHCNFGSTQIFSRLTGSFTERACEPGEDLRRPEVAVVAGKERLAKRGRPVHALHDGGRGASGERPDATPKPLMADAKHISPHRMTSTS